MDREDKMDTTPNGSDRASVKLPVTVLCGFLGSGKTTLLKEVLRNKKNLRVAVIVNDMAELNIDEKLIAKDVKLKQKEEKLVAMQNGCICCTLREDLLQEVAALANAGQFDYLLIESTGVSEPLPIAETFTFELDLPGMKDKALRPLAEIARLDTMVTVVDAHTFMKDLKSVELFADRTKDISDEDNKSVARLLVDQIDFADVIVINKTDLVTTEELGKIKALIDRMNPNAKVISTTHAKVPLEDIINTSRFNFDRAAQHPDWLKEARGSHTPETEEYGISSFVWKSLGRPFHPTRTTELLREALPSVLRIKGTCWFAHMMDQSVLLNGAGACCFFEAGTPWIVAMGDQELPEDKTLREELVAAAKAASEFGDRRQEVVIIGQSMDRVAIVNKLKACLLTDEEMALGPEGWAKFENPFYNDEDLSCEILPPVVKGSLPNAENLAVCVNLPTLFSAVLKPKSPSISILNRPSPLPDLGWLETILKRMDVLMEKAEDGDEDSAELAHTLLGEHITYCAENLNTKKNVKKLRGLVTEMIKGAFEPILKFGELEKTTVKEARSGIKLLIDDTASIVETFYLEWKKMKPTEQDLKDSSVFRIALDVMQSDMCPKYHIDHVALRALCTYFGPGTLFCASNGVNYKPLKALDAAQMKKIEEGEAHVDETPTKIQEFNDLIVEKQELVGRVATGDVLLLKGSAWPNNDFPAVHRSPPILAMEIGGEKHKGHKHTLETDQGETEAPISVRVLLRIDFVSKETAKKLMEAEEDSEDEDEEDSDADSMDDKPTSADVEMADD